MRQRVVNYTRQRFTKVEDAENFYGLDIEYYLSDAPTSGLESQEPSLRLYPVLASTIKSLTQQQLQEAMLIAVACVCDQKSLFLKMLAKVKLSSRVQMELIDFLFQPLVYQDTMDVLDKQFAKTAITEGIDTNLADFVSISLGAMKVLQAAEKPNLIYKWSKCVFGDNGTSLMPLHRMPFGLIQYQMEFFTCTNVMQVTYIY